MRDSATASVSLFDSETENPELVWTDKAKMKVKTTVTQQMQQWMTTQRTNPNAMWKVTSYDF